MIRQANRGDLEQIRELWLESFPCDNLFVSYYLTLCRTENILIYEENGELLSMLHFLNGWMKIGTDRERAAYIFGVATAIRARGRGLATMVLEELHRRLEPEYRYSLLVPQNESLQKFYKRTGYLPYFKIAEERVTLPVWHGRCRKAHYNDIPQLSEIYEKNLADRPHLMREREFWQILLDIEDLIVYPDKGKILGYCFFSFRKELRIYELFTTEDVSDKLLGYLRFLSNKAIRHIPSNSIEDPVLGMIRPLGKGKIPQKRNMAYMHMVFNT